MKSRAIEGATLRRNLGEALLGARGEAPDRSDADHREGRTG